MLSLGLVLVALVMPAWPASHLVVLVACAAALGPARVPVGTWCRTLAAPWTFVLVAVLPVAVSVDPAVRWWLTTSPESWARAADVLGHSLAGTSAVLLLAATTPASDLLPRLVRLGVPQAVVDVANVLYRMLFGLLDSVRTVRAAQLARLAGAGPVALVRSSAGLTSAVLLRSWERGRRLEEGLAGRSVGGDLTVLVEDRPGSWRFRLATVLVLVGIAVAGPLLRAGAA